MYVLDGEDGEIPELKDVTMGVIDAEVVTLEDVYRFRKMTDINQTCPLKVVELYWALNIFATSSPWSTMRRRSSSRSKRRGKGKDPASS